ncbi:hypothetical protein TSOC_007466 [Tetrabaena socialis]|uniref:Uncharacterized protein n=1 Tax=Tetrabaena socialis TaxID=47790 RepID=A0A2J8A101_9CHLO|nr:hypothetical protein TSOC_007466 [Tetrabaena socialis]|eukprot:PNH06202.1 hypothetical protein TSOC_007466 [Tetrabaena socialis]
MPPACFGRFDKRAELEEQRHSIETLTRRVGELSAELLEKKAEAQQELQRAREERDASLATAKAELAAEHERSQAASAQLEVREVELKGLREQNHATGSLLKHRERELASAKKQLASTLRERERATKKAAEFAATLEQVSTVLAGLQQEEEPLAAMAAGTSPVMHAGRKHNRQSTAQLQQLRQSIAVLTRDEKDGTTVDQS